MRLQQRQGRACWKASPAAELLTGVMIWPVWPLAGVTCLHGWPCCHDTISTEVTLRGEWETHSARGIPTALTCFPLTLSSLSPTLSFHCQFLLLWKIKKLKIKWQVVRFKAITITSVYSNNVFDFRSTKWIKKLHHFCEKISILQIYKWNQI